MSEQKHFLASRVALATALAVLAGAALAQEPGEEVEEAVVEAVEVEAAEPEEAREIEEITVIARKPGDRRRVDAEYEDPVRAQLLKDFYQMQEDQRESAWRDAAADENTSRVSWGYDPQEEYHMRNQMDLHSLPSERTKPATLFRLEF